MTGTNRYSIRRVSADSTSTTHKIIDCGTHRARRMGPELLISAIGLP